MLNFSTIEDDRVRDCSTSGDVLKHALVFCNLPVFIIASSAIGLRDVYIECILTNSIQHIGNRITGCHKLLEFLMN